MEINNNNLNELCKTIFVLPAVAYCYSFGEEIVTVDVCDPMMQELPLEFKEKASFATFELSKQEFTQITKIQL